MERDLRILDRDFANKHEGVGSGIQTVAKATIPQVLRAKFNAHVAAYYEDPHPNTMVYAPNADGYTESEQEALNSR